MTEIVEYEDRRFRIAKWSPEDSPRIEIKSMVGRSMDEAQELRPEWCWCCPYCAWSICHPASKPGTCPALGECNEVEDPE